MALMFSESSDFTSKLTSPMLSCDLQTKMGKEPMIKGQGDFFRQAIFLSMFSFMFCFMIWPMTWTGQLLSLVLICNELI